MGSSSISSFTRRLFQDHHIIAGLCPSYRSNIFEKITNSCDPDTQALLRSYEGEFNYLRRLEDLKNEGIIDNFDLRLLETTNVQQVSDDNFQKELYYACSWTLQIRQFLKRIFVDSQLHDNQVVSLVTLIVDHFNLNLEETLIHTFDLILEALKG